MQTTRMIFCLRVLHQHNTDITCNIHTDSSRFTLLQKPVLHKKPLIDATHWTLLPVTTICGQPQGTEMDLTRLFFWNLNGKLCGPGLNLYWPDWGEIEWRIWGERWSWPQPFHFLPPCSPHLALPSSHFLGKVEENIPLTVGMESIQLHLSLLFSPTCLHGDSLFPCTHCLEYSVRTSCLYAHVHKQGCILRHFSLSSTLSLLLLPPFAPSSSLLQ